MGDAGKLGLAILIFWVALVFFFFAFHPGGVADPLTGANVTSPGQMLQWLINEFQNTVSGTSNSGLNINAGIPPALPSDASNAPAPGSINSGIPGIGQPIETNAPSPGSINFGIPDIGQPIGGS